MRRPSLSLLSAALLLLAVGGGQVGHANPCATATPICAVEGQNFGVIIQTCAPATALISAPDPSHAEPVQRSDGTFAHRFVYRAPQGKRFTVRLCGADVVDFDLEGVSPLSEIRFEGSEGRNCSMKDYLVWQSPVSMIVATRTAKLKFAIQTSIVQAATSNAPTLGAATSLPPPIVPPPPPPPPPPVPPPPPRF